MELPFKVWIRKQVFYRILLALKNLKILSFKKTFYPNKIIKNKWKIYGKLFYLLFFRKSREVFFYFKLIVLFVLNLNEKIKLAEKTIGNVNFYQKGFLSSPKNEKIFGKKKILFPPSIGVKTLGKYLLFKGIIVKIGKVSQRIKSILLECSRCQSVFICLFESFGIEYSFLCIKKNCKSKIFFSFTTRVNIVIWQKLKVHEFPFMGNSQEGSKSIDVEVLGDNDYSFKIGDLVICQGQLKITRIEKKSRERKVYRNIFYFYIRGHGFIIFSLRLNPNKKFFLTRKEYSFFSNLNSGSSLFIFFMKTLNSIFNEHDSLKLVIILLVSFSSYPCKNKVKEKQDLSYLLFFNKISKINSFRNLINLLPRSFSLDLKNFELFSKKENFEKIGNNLDFFLKNCLRPGRKVFYIEETEKEEEVFFLRAIQKIKKATLLLSKAYSTPLIVGIRPILGYHQSNLNIFKNQEISKNLLFFFDLIFILIDRESKIEDQKNSRKIIKFFQKEGERLPKIGKKKKKYFLKKKQFSRFFFKRIFLFVQNQTAPFIPDKISRILIGFYKSFEISSDFDFSVSKIKFIEIVLHLAKGRAKMDLRKFVSIEDILDVTEAVSDAKFSPKQNWEFLALKRNIKGFRDILGIRKLLKEFRRFLSWKNQTIFDFKILRQNLKQREGGGKALEIVEILTRSNFIEKKNQNFFRIRKELLRI